jgi:hypothetical protein
MRNVRTLFLAVVAGAMVGAAALSESALAQAVHDPGVRGGPPGAGGPLPNLIPGGTGFFAAAQSFFTQVFSVSGTINDGAAIGAPNGGPGLGPLYNLNQCSCCHSQPAIGGTSPSVNPQVAVATLEGARNVVPPFITLNGPVREARFVHTRMARLMAKCTSCTRSPGVPMHLAAISRSRTSPRNSPKTMSFSASPRPLSALGS